MSSYSTSPLKFPYIKFPVQSLDDTNHSGLGHENVFLQRQLPFFMKEKSNAPM